MENSPFQHSSEQFTSKCREICKKNTRVNILAAFLRAQIHVDIFKLHLGGGGGGGKEFCRVAHMSEDIR